MENNCENRDNEDEMSGNRYWDETIYLFLVGFGNLYLKVPHLETSFED